MLDEPPAAPSLVHVTEKVPTHHRNLRLLAKIDYVTDPEDRSVHFHYERTDREYKLVALRTFEQWATEDGWIPQRALYYREIERRIIIDRLDKLVEQRFRELDELSEDMRLLHEWVTPLRDKDGNVRRHTSMIEEVDVKTGTFSRRPNPYDGLPMYALPFESMEKLIGAFLKLDERLMLKRGDATTRTETTEAGSLGRPSVLDPQTLITKPTRDEVQAMARALLFKRQPELLQQTVIDVESLTERGESGDKDNTI